MELKFILTGLGGQGVVFLTRLLSTTAVSLGHPIMVSETHGMSQRGGSVISHLKVSGSEAPLIRRGTADILIALEANEAVRNLAFLRRGGVAFVNAESRLPAELHEHLTRLEIQTHCLPASRLAVQLGSAAVANTIMAGFAHPFPIAALRQSVAEIASRRQELNLQALGLGYERSMTIDNESI
ncbi:MAG: indolepyruvate oxidoreductase [Chloroflexi bacterium]|nr:indolepyruvate oxidoreductase [Chloroflexota bacterium]